MLRFKDSSSKYWGYKDLKGKIIVPANLERFTTADTFYNVIEAHQKLGFSDETYFLFRNGKKIKKSSGLDFDFNYDCESEGKIIFRDISKDRVGFLNKDGEVEIPATYNSVHPFYNNLALVTRNAKKQCENLGEDTTTCEDYSWVDGETVLINPKNEVLISNINANTINLNWYSETINNLNVDSSIYVTLKGKGGDLYSFMDYEKEFNKWFYQSFLQHLKLDYVSQISDCYYPQIKYWSYKLSRWINIDKKDFSSLYPFETIKNTFINQHEREITISAQPLTQTVFKEKVYRNFYTSCGAHFKEKFPLFEVLISTYKRRKNKLKSKLFTEFDKTYALDYQENFDFIRIENDYKLILVSIK